MSGVEGLRRVRNADSLLPSGRLRGTHRRCDIHSGEDAPGGVESKGIQWLSECVSGMCDERERCAVYAHSPEDVRTEGEEEADGRIDWRGG